MPCRERVGSTYSNLMREKVGKLEFWSAISYFFTSSPTDPYLNPFYDCSSNRFWGQTTLITSSFVPQTGLPPSKCLVVVSGSQLWRLKKSRKHVMFFVTRVHPAVQAGAIMLRACRTAPFSAARPHQLCTSAAQGSSVWTMPQKSSAFFVHVFYLCQCQGD